jgi:ankyrin repeat protein
MRRRFRWVSCQIDALENCLDYPRLRKALKTLPKTLDETYDRILASIPNEYSTQAATILNLITWSTHQFKIEELVDAIATDLDEDPAFDPKNRMPVQRDVLKLCSSLVTVYQNRRGMDTVRLAHFSVKEYLVSDHVSETFKSPMSQMVAKSHLARLCLTHFICVSQLTILEQPVSSLDADELYCEFPFAVYSGKAWMEYARMSGCQDENLFELMLSFFLEKHKAFSAFANFHDCMTNHHVRYMPRSYRPEDNACEPDEIPSHDTARRHSHLYYAASGGLRRMVEYLLDNGAEINAEDSAALWIALSRSNETTVKLLLDRGADVSARGGVALGVAVQTGIVTLIQLLLDNGADINAGDGQPLIAAMPIIGFDPMTLQLLLDSGADPNATDGKAMHIAVEEEYEAAVELLLDHGADIDAEDGWALRKASRLGFVGIVRLLLDRGANPNAHSKSTLTALQEALECGYGKLVERLCEDYTRAEALELAGTMRYCKIARLLLERGADTNFPGGKWLDVLCEGGLSVQNVQQILRSDPYLGIDHLLFAMLDSGPQAEAVISVMLPFVTFELATQRSLYDRRTLLQHAAYCARETVTQRCLDLGVDIHAVDSTNATALHLAAASGKLVVVKLLVRAGANIEALGRRLRTPLGYAEDAEEDSKTINQSENFRKPPSCLDIIRYLSEKAHRLSAERDPTKRGRGLRRILEVEETRRERNISRRRSLAVDL